MLNHKKIISHLIKITLQAKPITPDSIKEFKQVWMADGVFVELDDSDFKEKQMALDEIFKDTRIKEYFPREYVEEKIQSIISRSFNIPLEKREKFFTDEIYKFYEDLKKNIKEWVILVPIDNLKIKENFSIGDVIFFPSDNHNFEKIANDLVTHILKNNPHYTDDEKKVILNQQLDIIRKSANGFTITLAEVKIKGIKEIAQKEAMQKVRIALHIARLYNLPSEHESTMQFGICGEVIRYNIRYTIRYDSDLTTVAPVSETTGFMFPFEFTDKRLEFMKNNGYEDLKNIFLSKKPTDFEKRLLTTIYWYGEALKTETFYESKTALEGNSDYKHLEYFNLNQKFLKLMIALESILLFDENEPITNNVAERVAFILESKFDGRKSIKSIIQRLYKLRSGIVHHGKSNLSKDDVNLLSWIVQKTIFNLIKLIKIVPLEEKEDLQKYLERLKLS